MCHLVIVRVTMRYLVIVRVTMRYLIIVRVTMCHLVIVRIIIRYLVIVDLPADNPEGGVGCVVVDLHLGEARRAARWQPLLGGVVIQHDRRPRLTDALLTAQYNTIQFRGTHCTIQFRRNNNTRTHRNWNLIKSN